MQHVIKIKIEFYQFAKKKIIEKFNVCEEITIICKVKKKIQYKLNALKYQQKFYENVTEKKKFTFKQTEEYLKKGI